MPSFDRARLTLPCSALLALLGCSSDDFTTSGTASSQGGAGSTVASSGAGASGGGGGADACSAGSVCVPEVPEGWTGPAAIYVGATPPAACDAPWVTAFTANAGKVNGSIECETCACAAPTGTVCSSPTVTVYAGGGCVGAMDTKQLVDGACASFTPGYGALATPSVPSGGSCAASGGAETKADPTWDESVLVCGGAVSAGACAGGSCMPAPAAPFAATLCVYRDGEEACPPSFNEKTVVYGDVADTRACSMCECATPTNGSCADAVKIYDDALCMDASVPPVLVADGTCKNDNYLNNAKFTAAAVGGACEPSGGQAEGDVQPATPVTVCCTAR